MDPDQALDNAHAALVAFRFSAMDGKSATRTLDAGEALADAFEALDAWLSQGGYLPTGWERER
jgi:hypothetical protein